MQAALRAGLARNKLSVICYSDVSNTSSEMTEVFKNFEKKIT